jgi:uncharacterized protein (DUF362 family)
MEKKEPAKGLNLYSDAPWSRRDFLRTTAVGAAGMALAGPLAACAMKTGTPRQGVGNLFTEGGNPLLIVVEGDNLEKMMEAGIGALGGLEKLVSGKKVVLKPNVVAGEPPPVTTAIDLLLSVGNQAKHAGGASIAACDANSSGVSKAGKFETLGFPPRLKEAGIALDAVDFGDRLAHVFVSKPTWQAHPEIGVVKTLHEADVIINLPMVKRHEASRFTCALKNHFGSVYGPLRFVAHNKMSKEQNGAKFFDRALAEFADAVRPELNIIDARTMLIRGGPSLSGKAEIKSGVNRIILCGDILASDVYCSKLMEEYDDSYSSEMIKNQLEAAEQLGLGVRDLKNVVIKEIVA